MWRSGVGARATHRAGFAGHLGRVPNVTKRAALLAGWRWKAARTISSHHSEIGRGTRLLIFSNLGQLPKLNVVGSIPIARSRFLADMAFRRSAAELAFPTFPIAFPMACSGLVLRGAVRQLELRHLPRLPDRSARVAQAWSKSVSAPPSTACGRGPPRRPPLP